MLLDIQWWLEFLPRYHRISLIKPSLWDFESLNFSTDACLQGGGATCQTECISFAFPDCISMLSLHINALELFTIVVALKHWAPQLQGRKFTVACDNSAAVAVITSNTSRDPFMQRCLRQLWFTAAVFDFVRYMCQEDTTSLQTTLVVGIPTLQLVIVSTAFVVTLVKFSIFKMLTLLVFLSTLRDNIFIQLFVFHL